MPPVVREFRRSDRDQLTALVNLHVASVLPGVALSTNVVLSQLEREPGELVIDPWVVQRCCLVAVDDDAIVGATLLLRFGDGPEIADGYRAAAEIRWLVVAPSSTSTGTELLAAAVERARAWQPTVIHLDGFLPAPGCYGIPDSWPHIRTLVTSAGFVGPTRTEAVLAARCEDLLGHRIEGAQVRRTVGALGARLDLVHPDGPLGYIEVGEIDQSLARSSAAATWTDVGNLFATAPDQLEVVMPALLSAAAEWLMLGGIDRLIDYHAEDVHPPEYLAVLHKLGFRVLSTNERGWTLRP
ncbi:MAG: GNAT family N-acetyltransferase [Actinomycetota bacterium]